MLAREKIEEILENLKNVKGIEESSAVTRDGLLVHSTLSNTYQYQTFVAMAATMFGAAEIASIELKKGVADRIIIESEAGKIIVTGAGSKILLVVTARSNSELGIILLEMKKTADRIKETL